MAVPKFEDFLYPFLNLIKDRDMTSKEMKDALIEHFHLTEEDCAVKTKSGTKTQVNDRINWVRQYLRRALFVELPQKGVYHITDRGKEYLQEHTSLSKKDLMVYPEFANYAIGETSTSEITPPQSPIEDELQDLTPTELFEQTFDSINRDLAEELLDTIMHQSPKFFEQVVVDVLKNMGYGYDMDESCKTTQYSRDDGIDGIIKEDKLGLSSIYLQAKRWNPATNNVGRPEIQKFIGALSEQGATKGVFITTSEFTKDARDCIPKNGVKLVLIDGKELAKYMIEFNVGVSTVKTYDIKCINSDYFEEL